MDYVEMQDQNYGVQIVELEQMESHELDFKYNLKSLLKRLTGCVPVYLFQEVKNLNENQ